MGKFVGLLAASVVLVAAVPASAASSFTGSGSIVLSNGNGFFGDGGIPAGSFTDTISFAAPGTGTQRVGVIYVGGSGISKLAASFNGVPLTFQPIGFGYNAGSYGLTVVAGQALSLIVSGVASTSSASYSGNFTFTPAAVPEPATWGLMMFGTGLAGGALRRRKRLTVARAV